MKHIIFPIAKSIIRTVDGATDLTEACRGSLDRRLFSLLFSATFIRVQTRKYIEQFFCFLYFSTTM